LERAPTTSGEFLSLFDPEDREHAWSQIRACIGARLRVVNRNGVTLSLTFAARTPTLAVE
jgi:hypothetical protein